MSRKDNKRIGIKKIKKLGVTLHLHFRRSQFTGKQSDGIRQFHKLEVREKNMLAYISYSSICLLQQLQIKSSYQSSHDPNHMDVINVIQLVQKCRNNKLSAKTVASDKQCKTTAPGVKVENIITSYRLVLHNYKYFYQTTKKRHKLKLYIISNSQSGEDMYVK